MNARPACPNCGTPAGGGEYCTACGQRNRHGRLRFGELIGDVVDQFMELRMPWLRTFVDMWWRPGLVALDYVEGRRARYVNPVKYCFVVLAISILLAAVIEGRRSAAGVPGNVIALMAIPFEVLALRLVMWGTTRNLTEIAVLALYLSTQVLVAAMLVTVPLELFKADLPASRLLIPVVFGLMSVVGIVGIAQFFSASVWRAAAALVVAMFLAFNALVVLDLAFGLELHL